MDFGSFLRQRERGRGRGNSGFDAGPPFTTPDPLAPALGSSGSGFGGDPYYGQQGGMTGPVAPESEYYQESGPGSTYYPDSHSGPGTGRGWHRGGEGFADHGFDAPARGRGMGRPWRGRGMERPMEGPHEGAEMMGGDQFDRPARGGQFDRPSRGRGMNRRARGNAAEGPGRGGMHKPGMTGGGADIGEQEHYLEEYEQSAQVFDYGAGTETYQDYSDYTGKSAEAYQQPYESYQAYTGDYEDYAEDSGEYTTGMYIFSEAKPLHQSDADDNSGVAEEHQKSDEHAELETGDHVAHKDEDVTEANKSEDPNQSCAAEEQKEQKNLVDYEEEDDDETADALKKLPASHSRGVMSTLINMMGPEALNRKPDPLPPMKPAKPDENTKSASVKDQAEKSAKEKNQSQKNEKKGEEDSDEESEDDEASKVIKKLPASHNRGVMSTLIGMLGTDALNRKPDPLPPPRPAKLKDDYETYLKGKGSGAAGVKKAREDGDQADGQWERKDYHDVMELPPEERDLNPDDFADTGVSELYCKICAIQTTSQKNFQAHLDGKNHRAKLMSIQSGKITSAQKISKKKMYRYFSRSELGSKSMVMDAVKNGKGEPILGLSFITEFQSYFQLMCVCNLCGVKFDHNAVISHVTGTKHRLHYMREKRPSEYVHCKRFGGKKSQLNNFLLELSTDIEKEDGRGEPVLKVFDTLPGIEKLKGDFKGSTDSTKTKDDSLTVQKPDDDTAAGKKEEKSGQDSDDDRDEVELDVEAEASFSSWVDTEYKKSREAHDRKKSPSPSEDRFPDKGRRFDPGRESPGRSDNDPYRRRRDPYPPHMFPPDGPGPRHRFEGPDRRGHPPFDDMRQPRRHRFDGPPDPYDMHGPPGYPPRPHMDRYGPPGYPPHAYPPRDGPHPYPPRDGPPGYPPRDGPPGYTPRDGPPGYPPRDGPPGYPPRDGPPGYPPRDGPPGYPPRDGPPGYPPRDAPPGYPPRDVPPAYPPREAPAPAPLPPHLDPDPIRRLDALRKARQEREQEILNRKKPALDPDPLKRVLKRDAVHKPTVIDYSHRSGSSNTDVSSTGPRKRTATSWEDDIEDILFQDKKKDLNSLAALSNMYSSPERSPPPRPKEESKLDKILPFSKSYLEISENKKRLKDLRKKAQSPPVSGVGARYTNPTPTSKRNRSSSSSSSSSSSRSPSPKRPAVKTSPQGSNRSRGSQPALPSRDPGPMRPGQRLRSRSPVRQAVPPRGRNSRSPERSRGTGFPPQRRSPIPDRRNERGAEQSKPPYPASGEAKARGAPIPDRRNERGAEQSKTPYPASGEARGRVDPPRFPYSDRGRDQRGNDHSRASAPSSGPKSHHPPAVDRKRDERRPEHGRSPTRASAELPWLPKSAVIRDEKSERRPEHGRSPARTSAELPWLPKSAVIRTETRNRPPSETGSKAKEGPGKPAPPPPKAAKRPSVEKAAAPKPPPLPPPPAQETSHTEEDNEDAQAERIADMLLKMSSTLSTEGDTQATLQALLSNPDLAQTILEAQTQLEKSEKSPPRPANPPSKDSKPRPVSAFRTAQPPSSGRPSVPEVKKPPAAPTRERVAFSLGAGRTSLQQSSAFNVSDSDEEEGAK